MTTLLESGFVDTFRHFYPDLENAYSWWSYRFNARANNAGWRIDYFLVSEALKPTIEKAQPSDPKSQAADHCPVVLELE